MMERETEITKRSRNAPLEAFTPHGRNTNISMEVPSDDEI